MKRLGIMLAGALLMMQCACGSAATQVTLEATNSQDGAPEPAAELTTDMKLQQPEEDAPAEEPENSTTEDGDRDADEADAPAATPAAIPDTTPAATPDITPTAAPAVTPDIKPAAEVPTETTSEVPSAPVNVDNNPTEAAVDLKTVAAGYIGQSTTALFSVIGRPISSDYAPSCLGEGEDGNLYYDSFTVFTYRENGLEIINYVE